MSARLFLIVLITRCFSCLSPGAQVPESVVAMEALRYAKRRPRVVASLTTFPWGDRMAGIERTLDSMANQTWLPDELIINFPESVDRLATGPLALPPQVETWRHKYKWLTIHQTKDYGPATKLLGTLELKLDANDIVIILDDDTGYHHDAVLALVSTMLSSPVDIAPCFQCEEVWRDWRGTLRWNYKGAEGICNGFSSGYAMHAVRPRFFDDRVWNHSLGPKGCRLHDDVWVSGSMLIASGVHPYVIRPGFDSVQWELIQEQGKRQAESIHIADKEAKKRGEDPQGSCVAHFPYIDRAKSVL